MEPEVMTERMEELFHNNPVNSIERLPEGIREAINNFIMSMALDFESYIEKYDARSVIAGAIAKSFFAGHEYAVKYGNLNAEMEEVTNETS